MGRVGGSLLVVLAVVLVAAAAGVGAMDYADVEEAELVTAESFEKDDRMAFRLYYNYGGSGAANGTDGQTVVGRYFPKLDDLW